jgi:AcrR family transcriptional regulator
MARYQVGMQTEAKIVDAARELLAEHGLDGTTLKAICDRAGIQAGSFYNLFDSKEELVIRVVRESINAIDPDPEGAGRDTLDDLVEAYIRFITQETEVARIYIQVAVTGGQTQRGAATRFLRHHERRVQRFADAMRRAEPELTENESLARAEVLLGALDGLAFRWMLDIAFDFATHARRAAACFV